MQENEIKFCTHLIEIITHIVTKFHYNYTIFSRDVPIQTYTLQNQRNALRHNDPYN